MNIILMRLELIDYHYNFLQTTSVTESINDTGKNYGGKNGNYSGSVVVIGIGASFSRSCVCISKAAVLITVGFNKNEYHIDEA